MKPTPTPEMIEAALHARVPGGAEVWAWLPQKDAWTPHETARDVMHAALSAALSVPAAAVVGEPERDEMVRKVVGLCNRVSGATTWNAAEWMYDELAARKPLAWPIDTDDQVEALARECDWDNRKYMTPKDYEIWCERMRKFARLAAPSAPDGLDEQALDKAAREGYAVRCKTHGPRVLDQYASTDIMQLQLDDARVIVSAYLSALGGKP